jgi:hypothetical protein
MTRAASDLALQLVPPPSQAVQYGQGKLLSWDRDTFENEVEWRGVTLSNLPVLAGPDALTFAAGDTVGLLGWDAGGKHGTGSWCILGRLILPGSGVAEQRVDFLRQEFVSQIIDDLVVELLDSPAGRTLIDGIVEDLLVSPAGQELAAFVLSSRIHSATTDTSPPETTQSTSYGNLSTVGPTVSGVDISESGRALVLVGGDVRYEQVEGGSGRAHMSFEVSGATSFLPANARSREQFVRLSLGSSVGSVISDVGSTSSAAILLDNLNSGTHTFQAKYRSSDGGFASFRRRNLTIIAF